METGGIGCGVGVEGCGLRGGAGDGGGFGGGGVNRGTGSVLRDNGGMLTVSRNSVSVLRGVTFFSATIFSTSSRVRKLGCPPAGGGGALSEPISTNGILCP